MKISIKIVFIQFILFLISSTANFVEEDGVIILT